MVGLLASGAKLAKKANGAFTQFYNGSVVYKGDKIAEYISTSEGLAMKTASGFAYQYNLSDHLGNVRVVLNQDKSVAQSTNYYPFGLAHATSALEKNKYLYNGKEIQSDVIGGTPFGMLDYGARFYDPVIARWHSIDPLASKYAGLSGYNYVGNNPMKFIDPDGEKITLSDAYTTTMTNLAKIGTTSVGRDVINRLVSHPYKTFSINTVFFRGSTNYEDENSTINYINNPWWIRGKVDGGSLSAEVALGHEMYHAYQDATGVLNTNGNDNIRKMEWGAVGFGNYLRESFGQLPLRNGYSPLFSGKGNMPKVDSKISDFTTLGSESKNKEKQMGFSYNQKSANEQTTKYIITKYNEKNSTFYFYHYNSKAEYDKAWEK